MSEDKPKKKKHAARDQRQELLAKEKERLAAVPDPLSRENLKKIGLRIGIGAVILWGVALALPTWIPKAIAGALTALVLGVLAWAFRFMRKSRAVADIVRSAEGAEGRKKAIEQLESGFKEGDTAATFAKAQLQLQEDPKAALVTLESIKLDKVMASVADEARSQRAMIHLILGETDKARALVDGIDLSRHKEPKVRATLAAVIGEAWARSGQAKKAIELCETFDLSDAEYKDLKPQLLRSLAFAYAWADQLKKMRATLQQLGAVNPQLLMGFITKKKHPAGVNARGVHPALEQEALKLVQRSGAVQRRVEVRRM